MTHVTIGRAFEHAGHGHVGHEPGQAAAAGAADMTRDPICGMMVSKATALATEREVELF